MLGATLVLAGDAMRDAQDAKPGAPAPARPPEAHKIKPKAAVPEPRFAAGAPPVARKPGLRRARRAPPAEIAAPASRQLAAAVAPLSPLPFSLRPQPPLPQSQPDQRLPDLVPPDQALSDQVLSNEPGAALPAETDVAAPPVAASGRAVPGDAPMSVLAAAPLTPAAALPELALADPVLPLSVQPERVFLAEAVAPSQAQRARIEAVPLPAMPEAGEATSAPEVAVTAAKRLPEPAFGKAPAPLPASSAATSPEELAPAPPPSPPASVSPPPPPATIKLASNEARPPSRVAPSPGLSSAPSPAPHRAARSIPRARMDMPEPTFGQPATKPVIAASAGIASKTARTVLAPATALAPAPVSSGGGVANSTPASGPAPVLSDEDELILQIETGQGELSDTITGYGLRSGVYLPLGALTRFLDLPIAISDEGNYASGWFLDEKRTLVLNLRAGTLMVAGQPVALGRADAVAYQGELYLRAERLAALFPLDLKVDLRSQTVAVRTREPFPFEERQIREALRERLGGRAARGPAKGFAREETPWRAATFPLSEAELRAIADDQQGARVEGDFRFAGDLAFMTARVFASASSRDGLTAARLELGRRDPDGDLLGPLGATEFQLGDVSTAALPVGLRGIGGRGAFITNTPLEQASIFDSIDLRGDLATGYEVELYRNNTLIGSTARAINGQYQFLQVPVDFGLNVFRLVFYGPQGQRREVVRRISVGDGRLAPGQFVYSLGAAQRDVNLLGVRGPRFIPGQDYGAWRGSAEIGYGISRALTASLGAGFYQTGAIGAWRNRWLVTGGLRTGLGSTALRLDLGVQDGGGKSAEVGVGGKLFGVAYALNHAEYSGGAIDEVRAFTADPLRRATELNLNATLQLGAAGASRALPLTARLRRIEFADGRGLTDAALRASLPLSGLILSNTLEYSGQRSPQGALNSAATSRLTGSFDLATLGGSRTRLRASFDYGIIPGPKLIAATIAADRSFGPRTELRAAVSHTLADHETTLGFSAIHRLRAASLAFDGSYGARSGHYSLTMRLGVSFGRNPLTGRMFLARPGLAAALRAFADDNGNGHFDPGEPPVPDVTFLSGTEETKTDAAGRALIAGLGDGTRASVRVDADSLPDITLAAARPGIELVPRPGRVHVSDFAIVSLSDVEGTAYFRSGSADRAVSRLRLRMVRPDGTIAASARTESDGFYLFERLAAGDYRLELDPEQAATLKIRIEAPIALKVSGKSRVLRQPVYVLANPQG
ncbi:hypothetical protein [Novosphingobium sp. Chol11]|uniref:hypothetical protein n=1 Tax=Novosphingobium sp. Chol11 TaxID=1385763 RepID=UPI0025F87593|nr:hypothetical protein [Novosphingobium sp. Chol11]